MPPHHDPVVESLPPIEVSVGERAEHVAHYAITAVAVLLAFPRFGIAKLGGMPLTPADLGFVVAAALFALRVVTQPTRLRRSPLWFAIGAYGLAIAVTVPFSTDLRRSVIKAVVEGYLLALAFLTFELANTAERRERLARGFVVAGLITTVVCLVGIVLFYLGVRDRAGNLALVSYGSLPPGNYPRVRGLFLNMNMMCSYLVVAHLLLLRDLDEPFFRGARGYVAAAASFLVSLFTLSFGIGGMLIGTAFAAVARFQTGVMRVLSRVGAGFAGLGAVLLVVMVFVPTNSGDSESSRMIIWRQAARTFAEHPLVGQGVGTDPVDVLWRDPTGNDEHLHEAHNIWLSVAAQEGLVGLAGFLAMLGLFLRGWWLAERDTLRSARERSLVRTLGLAFVFALLWSGFGSSLEDSRHVWVLIGLFGAACHRPEDTRDAEAVEGTKPA